LGDIGTYEGYTYSLACATGVFPASTTGDILQIRNATANRKIRLLKLTVNAASVTAAGTGNVAVVSAFVARAFSAAGTGGTALTISGNDQKMRTSQNPSILTVRVATTAALGTGTRTLDDNSFGNIVCGAPATAGANMILDVPLYADVVSAYGIPLVLAQNEGIVVQLTTGLPASCTATFGFNMQWVEIDGGTYGTG
jgi:hypothetical protein